MILFTTELLTGRTEFQAGKGIAEQDLFRDSDFFETVDFLIRHYGKLLKKQCFIDFIRIINNNILIVKRKTIKCCFIFIKKETCSNEF